MLDQILGGSSNNSTQRAVMLANEITSTIQDQNLEAAMELSNLEYARRVEEYKMDYTDYQNRVALGQTTATQVLEEIRNNRYSALQGYAAEIDAMAKENEQYLTAYGQELERVQMAVDMIYKSIETQLNTIDAAIAAKVQEAFDAYWADYAANKQAREAAGDDAWQNFMDIMTLIVALITGADLLNPKKET